ncbi:efflux transporter outer membrane subunit [Castellaniella sp. S9]|uniref:efflux transporter outer membrane subunit n=1 Tax=Castellaniella sp. S9 TaxID=2993652 RepID=UPI0022B2B79D|nr:efflux transporter outer membrane subunit [Castellaniella sp. S9]
MKPLFALALVLALSACAPMDPGQPAVQPLDGAGIGLRDDITVQWPTTEWWRRYRDPQLEGLVARALAGSPSLEAAGARVRMANAAVRNARALQWPQVDARYRMTRQHYSENYIYPPPLGGSMDTDNSLTLQVDLDLDLWGRQRALSAAARSNALAAQAEQQQARSLLVSAVVQSYFQLQDALAQSTTLESIVGKQQNALDITQDRYTHGLSTQVDVDQAASAVSATRVQLAQARNNAELLRHQLAALAGTGPDGLPTVAPHKGTALPEGVPEHMPLALLGRRADVVAARLQAEAAGAEVSAAKADFFPNVNLSAFAGFMSLGMDQLLRGDSRSYGAGPAITLPIFHAGALNAQLEGRRAARDLAIAQYNQTVLGAVREVADASASIRSLREQIRHQEASLAASTSAYDIALKRYQAGLGNFVQVLLAQSDALTQAVHATDLRARAYILDARLATALGGGYQPAPASTAH